MAGVEVSVACTLVGYTARVYSPFLITDLLESLCAWITKVELINRDVYLIS